MNNTLYGETDSEAERRRVLGKVYALLIKLAEEAQNTAVETPKPDTEKIEESTSKEETTSGEEIELSGDAGASSDGTAANEGNVHSL